MTDYTLRPVTEADYGFIYALNRTTMQPYVEPIWGWDEAFQREAFARRWNPDNQQIIVVNGRDAGRITLNETPELIYLAQINLLPEFQGKGIGTAVIQSIQANAERAGKFVELRVLKTNPDARRLYERLGFTVFDETDTHFWMRWQPK
jgi:ribosomal protein S18 acetylase RimI-like enzyme